MANGRRPLTRHNGAAIRDFRIKLGMDVQQLADAVGLSAKAVYNIETDTKETRRENLYRIAKVLDVSIGSILRDPGYATSTGVPGGNGRTAA